MTIYNSPKEAGLTVDDEKIANPGKKMESAQYAWYKVILQIFRSPFLWVLLQGDFLTAVLKSGISDWVQLYLIQDKEQSRATGNGILYKQWYFNLYNNPYE